MLGLSIGAGIAAFLLVVAVGIPAAALGFGGWAIAGGVGAIIAGSLGAVFLVGVLLAAWGAYSAYSSVYWTLLYRQVRGLPAPAGSGAMAPA